MKDEAYASYFGFDEKEVSELLSYYGLELDEGVKEMYDGYRMGNQDIYNPWSIIKYGRYRGIVTLLAKYECEPNDQKRF